jgi:hypothetical protein
MRIRYVVIGAAVVILLPVVVIGWWLLSPLFIDKTVEEEFPFTAGAEIPPDITREEAEMIMSGMAKLDQEVNEAMPDPMTGSQSGGATGQTNSSAEAVALQRGSFRDADSFHQGSGEAVIYRGPDGSHLLRLENFSVTNGPDLHVILTPNLDPQSRAEVSSAGYVDLGSLKGNMGNQNYEIPDGVDIDSFGSVVIYCQPFHVIFSVASLENLG